ncbi:hypothetical protein [Lysobacter sp. GCM10012299]|uniref:hypothetical protein n=1 Tax=Lysobacter sp. GCM10012299 TaxID=3317333 RepID=UPI00360E72D7
MSTKQAPSAEAETSFVCRQIRGEALRARILDVIRQLAAEAAAQRLAYVYNASEVARRVPTTRKTLAKHDNTVSKALLDLASRRRQVNGDGTIELLRAQIAKLQEVIKEQEGLIDGLRRHHLEIYSRLRANSIEGELLVRPIVAAEARAMATCPTCQSSIDQKGGGGVLAPVAIRVGFDKPRHGHMSGS